MGRRAKTSFDLRSMCSEGRAAFATRVTGVILLPVGLLVLLGRRLVMKVRPEASREGLAAPG
jgi:hypothetical protein